MRDNGQCVLDGFSTNPVHRCPSTAAITISSRHSAHCTQRSHAFEAPRFLALRPSPPIRYGNQHETAKQVQAASENRNLTHYNFLSSGRGHAAPIAELLASAGTSRNPRTGRSALKIPTLGQGRTKWRVIQRACDQKRCLEGGAHRLSARPPGHVGKAEHPSNERRQQGMTNVIILCNG